MNPHLDLKPGDKLLSCGYDWSWCFVIFADVYGADGYRIGSNAKTYSCWKVRAKSGGGHSGTERYKSSEWHLILGSVQKSNGYHAVSLQHDSGKRQYRPTHAMMVNAFYGHRPGWEAAHNNSIKTDNRFVNLRWATHRDNQMDRVEAGNSNRGSRHGLAKLTEADVANIRKWRSEGVPVKDMVDRLGGKVKLRAVYTVIRGERWSY